MLGVRSVRARCDSVFINPCNFARVRRTISQGDSSRLRGETGERKRLSLKISQVKTHSLRFHIQQLCLESDILIALHSLCAVVLVSIERASIFGMMSCSCISWQTWGGGVAIIADSV